MEPGHLCQENALLLVDELQLKERFVELATKELRLRKRQFESVQKNAAKIVAQAEKQLADS